MVLPVTGPITKVQSLLTTVPGSSVYDYYSHKESWKQARPYDRPLPYLHRWAVLRGPRTGVESTSSPYDAALASTMGFDSSHFNGLKIRAYEKLKADFGAQAELGAAVATFSQSLDMITGRTLQLLRFARKLKKFDFKGAARGLSWPTGRPPPKRGPRTRDFGSAWLEYSYGWSPLIGDIFNALDVLGKTDFSERGIKGVASSGGYRWYDGNVKPNPWANSKEFAATFCILKYQANVRITNPNLLLWNQLGLVNPATIIWEVIPFSFVVDWFVNVQQFLATGTDWLGVQKTHEFTTYFQRGYVRSYWGNPPGGSSTFDVMRMQRVSGIDKPELALRPLRVWGWQRGLNAVSLLTQFLKSV